MFMFGLSTVSWNISLAVIFEYLAESALTSSMKTWPGRPAFSSFSIHLAVRGATAAFQRSSSASRHIDDLDAGFFGPAKTDHVTDAVEALCIGLCRLAGPGVVHKLQILRQIVEEIT